MVVAEYWALKGRSAEDARMIEALRTELASLEAKTARECEDRRAADTAARQATERFGSLEQVLRSTAATNAPVPLD